MNRALLTTALLCSLAALAATPNATAVCTENPPDTWFLLGRTDCNDGTDGYYETAKCNLYNVGSHHGGPGTPYTELQLCFASEAGYVCVYSIVLDAPQERTCVPVPNP